MYHIVTNDTTNVSVLFYSVYSLLLNTVFTTVRLLTVSVLSFVSSESAKTRIE